MSAALIGRSSAGVPGATRNGIWLGYARFRLQEMIEGKKQRIEALGKDRFGRPLVNVYLRNGREVGRELIREGFAGSGGKATGLTGAFSTCGQDQPD